MASNVTDPRDIDAIHKFLAANPVYVSSDAGHRI